MSVKIEYEISWHTFVVLDVEGKERHFVHMKNSWYEITSGIEGFDYEEITNSLIVALLDEKLKCMQRESRKVGGSGLNNKEIEKFLDAVVECGQLMYEKFYKKGMNGKCGWDDVEWATGEEWIEIFDKHVRKAGYESFQSVDDLIDLMNFIAFRIYSIGR